MKDFGDGPGGAVYQRQLNVFVRYLYKIGAQYLLDELHRLGHNISDILGQIKREAQYIYINSANYNALDDHGTDSATCYNVGPVLFVATGGHPCHTDDSEDDNQGDVEHSGKGTAGDFDCWPWH